MPKRLIGLLMLGFVLQLQPSTAGAVEPFAVTVTELAQMPSYCQAKYGKDRGNQAINEQWIAIYGGHNWENMHHYCDALKFIIRANRSFGNKADQRYNLEQAQNSIEHLLTVEQTPDWILRPEAYVNLGKVLLSMSRLGRASKGEAVLNFEKAIEIKPDYAPAYAALSDLYVDLGQKSKSIAALEQGLQHAPDTVSLQRRYKQLTGKTFVPPPSSGQAAQTPKPPDAATATPAQQDAPTSGSAPANAAPADMPEKIGVPGNPYCRFCP